MHNLPKFIEDRNMAIKQELYKIDDSGVAVLPLKKYLKICAANYQVL